MFDIYNKAGAWSQESLQATIVLAMGVVTIVGSGLEMKRADGFRNIPASLSATFLFAVNICCDILLLDWFRLSTIWAIHTVLELGGVALAGVLFRNEELGRLKLCGLLLSITGLTIMEGLGTSLAESTEDSDSPCKPVVNFPVLIAVLAVAQWITTCWARPRPSWSCIKLLDEYADVEEGQSPGAVDPAALFSTVFLASRKRLQTVLLYLGVLTTGCLSILLADCTKQADGFADLNYTMLSFLVAFIDMFLLVGTLQYGPLVFAWTAHITIEFFGVQLLAFLKFGEPVGYVQATGLILSGFGVVALALADEYEEDSEHANCVDEETKAP